jgi:hypothetical protein
MRPFTLLVLTVQAAFACACASQADGLESQQRAQDDYGLRKSLPIEVCRPDGQRAYLASLVCADGSLPSYRRTANVGPRTELPASWTPKDAMEYFVRARRGELLNPGEADYHVIDAYEVACKESKHTLYLDMYHCAQSLPERAPRGFARR